MLQPLLFAPAQSQGHQQLGALATDTLDTIFDNTNFA